MEKQFLIVGQGIAGSLLAYHMYKAGMNFKIISCRETGNASSVATGIYSPLVLSDLSKTWMVDECLPVMLQTYSLLEQELGEKFIYQKDILKSLLQDELDFWQMKKVEESLSKYIAEIGICPHIEGLNDFDNCGRITHSGYLHIARLLEKLRLFFQKKNLLIEAEFQYKDLGFIDNKIIWKGIVANTIVFCEGFRATENPYFKNIAFQLSKGELLEIECLNLQEDCILNKNVYLLPLGNHKFKVGASGEEKEKEESNLEYQLNQLMSVPYKVLNYWAGTRPVIADKKPVLGIHPLHEKIAIFNGLGRHGVLMAPYFAREMVRFLSVHDYPLNPEIDIKRFVKQKRSSV